MTTAPAPLPLDSTGRRLYAQADELRAGAPAHRVALPGGLTAWSVTRGDVAKRLLLHPDVSKDARRSWPGYRPYAIPWLTAWVDVVSMFTSDGDDHQRLRALVSRAFTPRRIEELRPAIQKLVDGLLDGLAATPPGTAVDLRPAFSYPIPSGVICDLFGVPDAQRPAMLRVIDRVLDTELSGEEHARVGQEMYGAMHALLAAKHAEPGDDMTSALLREQERDGDSLSDDEVVSTLILMIGAGSETAVALIDHLIHTLLTRPDVRAAVLADPSRWEDAVEETLRLHPPVMHLPLRYAAADLDLGEGVVIGRGELILIGFGAHGRDPGVHAAADTFDLDRADKQHLAFGHGVHYCLGAPLARLEALVAVPSLLARFPGLRAADGDGDLPRRASFIGNELASLPVLLDGAGVSPA